MRDDDDIIAAYEGDFDDVPRRPRSNRGFWMVAGTIALGAVILLVEIFAHRPFVNDIAQTEHDLRVSLDRANAIYADSGSFSEADAEGLSRGQSGLAYVGPDEPSSGPDTISVLAASNVWAASVRARTGTCFSLKRTSAGTTTYLIADGVCTGRAGLAAVDDRW